MNESKVFYTRTYADGTEQRFSIEDYEKNVLPTLGEGGQFHLGGDMSKHLAPNGKPSNLTHEQWHLVRTPEFKAWFGDWEEAYHTGDYEGVSKVIDLNGDPLVCYHGTSKSFYVFDLKYAGKQTKVDWGYLGFFFTPSMDLALDFTRYKWSNNKSKYKSGSKVLACFLNVKNPKIVQARQFVMMSETGKFYREASLKQQYDGWIIEKFDIEEKQSWERIFQDDSSKEFDYNQYVAFYPTQIKLADGSNTTFDGSNPDIRFELGGIYHGSPHKFEKFSTEFMGSGEGAQAFGWGLYFTSLQDIARNYAEQLSRKSFNGTNTMSKEDVNKLSDKNITQSEFEEIRDRNIERITRILNNIPELERLGYIEKGENPLLAGYGKQLYDLDLNALLKAKNVNDVIATRNLYKVTLHKGKTPDQYTWLEWDKPLSKQSEATKKALEKQFSLPSFDADFRTAADFYRSRARKFDSDKKASEELLLLGIDGIKYPAESISRGATSDTARGFNYVVFDPNAVTIEEVQQFAKGGQFHLGGDMSKHLAPNGKPSNLTHEQWHLVRTPEFKAWFGDWENSPETASKVIDENGEPKVVYHGTSALFNTFKEEEKGRRGSLNEKFWSFTTNIEQAKIYALDNRLYGSFSSPRIIPVFLNIKEMPTYDNEGKFYRELEVWGGYKFIDIFQLQDWHSRGFNMGVEFKEVDGFCVKNTIEMENINGIKDPNKLLGDTYYVKNSEQIKLADGTNTTFDGSNPDIRFAEGGVTNMIEYKIEQNKPTQISISLYYKNKWSGDLTTETPYLKDDENYVELVGIGINNKLLRGKGLAAEMIFLMLKNLGKQGVEGIKSINKGGYSDKGGRTLAAEKMWNNLKKDDRFKVVQHGENFKISLNKYPDIRYAKGGVFPSLITSYSQLGW